MDPKQPRQTDKAKAREQRHQWRIALAEGRVVRFPHLRMLTAYPTKAEAEAAAATMEGVLVVAEGS